MDFMAAVARGGKAKEWFYAGDGNRAKTLIGTIIQWVQMTDEDVSVCGRNVLLLLISAGRRRMHGPITPMPLLPKKTMIPRPTASVLLDSTCLLYDSIFSYHVELY